MHSALEEIDIVVRNESTEEFWKRFGSIILIECKNWHSSTKPGRSDFDAFYGKIARRGSEDCRLGFFISLNGVTEPFAEAQRTIAKERIRIVCIDEDGLWQLIIAGNRSEYLKDLVTKQLTS